MIYYIRCYQKKWHITRKWAWLWSRGRFFNFAVCRDAARRAGLSATAENIINFVIFNSEKFAEYAMQYGVKF